MNRRKGRSTSSSFIGIIVGDAVNSFCTSTVGSLYSCINSHHGLYCWLLIGTTLYYIIDVRFPHNSSSPASMLSEYAAGKGDDTLLYLVLRSIAQAIGWWASNITMKEDTAAPGAGGKGRLTLDQLAITEVAISFTNSFCILYLETIDAGPSGNMLKDWLFTFVIMCLWEVFEFEANNLNPNPASRFGEDYAKDHISWEYHFFMYWFCPLTGAVIAGWAFRIFVMIKRISRVILSAIVWLRM